MTSANDRPDEERDRRERQHRGGATQAPVAIGGGVHSSGR